MPKESDLARRAGGLRVSKYAVVRVQHRRSSGLHVAEQLGLCRGHIVQRAQELEVRRSDVRDHAHLGIDEPRQQVDLAGSAHAHFNYRCPVPCLELQQRERHADMVVQVPLVLEHRSLLLQDGGDHLLGRGLAVAAGDADEGNRMLLAVHQGHLLEREERVLHGEDVLQPAQAVIAGLQGRAVHQRAPGALLDRIGNEIVAVETVALEGHEQTRLP